MKDLVHLARTTRPVLGGLLLVLAGAEIIWIDGRPVAVAMSGSSGSLPILLGGSLVLFGLLAWVTPLYAPMIGLLAQGAALLSFVAANLGGYVLGSVLGIVGGALVFAWRSEPCDLTEVGT
ncbi:DUF6114 domain-containing protein [Janibacter sp. GS2]|uniref:DUF6114 domain-containing protein n=1 Tax=Janibacter sp. GS2 TaxID=3442646 RepID=UPI003EBAA616